jgi:hypothetical protein
MTCDYQIEVSDSTHSNIHSELLSVYTKSNRTWLLGFCLWNSSRDLNGHSISIFEFLATSQPTIQPVWSLMLFPFFFVARYVPTAEQPHKVIISRLWLVGTQAAGDFFQFCLEVESRICFNDLLEFVDGNNSPRGIRPEEIGHDAVGDDGDARLAMQRDGRRGVQGDGIPDQLDTLLGPFGVSGFGVSFDEFPCCVGAIDFEALIFRNQGWRTRPAQIVQGCCEEYCLRVTACKGRDFLRNNQRKERAAHDMVCHCGCIVLLYIGKSFGREVGDRELYASNW